MVEPSSSPPSPLEGDLEENFMWLRKKENPTVLHESRATLGRHKGRRARREKKEGGRQPRSRFDPVAVEAERLAVAFPFEISRRIAGSRYRRRVWRSCPKKSRTHGARGGGDASDTARYGTTR